MRLLLAVAVATSFATAGYAAACPGKDKKAAEVASISVKKAAKLAKLGKVIMVDANSDATRKSQGVVPGARLLSSYRDFKPSELRASKSDTLVFYCYNEQCSAAPSAARAAKAKGFKTLVMHAGIMGWKKAGHTVAKI